MEHPEDMITGDWGNFTFHMATMADLEAIIQNVRDTFLRFEPMHEVLGWCEENAAYHDRLVEIMLSHRLSYYVTEKGKDKVIGCNLLLDSRLEGFSGVEIKSPVSKKIMGFLAKLDEDMSKEFHHQFPCDYYADIYITAVDPAFSGLGIGTEMYRRALPFLKAKGFPVLKVELTAEGSRAIGNKFGFIELGRIYLKDYMDENGIKHYPSAKDEFVVATAKFL